MEFLLFLLSALGAYFIAGINPAIVLSKMIYKKDIRTVGSGNPGFTNFKRSFGMPWAIPVLILDLGKAAAVVAVCSYFFGQELGLAQLGSAWTGLFCMLGHAYPVWYGFRGGKGFLVLMSVIWFVDWRGGLCATILLVVLLLTTQYMSLSTMLAVTGGVLSLFIFRDYESLWVPILCLIQVLFMVYRHRENIKRLVKGTETKFSFFKGKK